LKITWKQLTIIFITGFIADFFGTWMGYAIAHKQILTQAVIGFFLPFLTFVSMSFFVEAKTRAERFKITCATAFAFSLGGTVMLMVMN
jgi:hypothetical protein